MLYAAVPCPSTPTAGTAAGKHYRRMRNVTEDSGTGFPASLDVAWGLRDRPHRGPKPGLSLDRIVVAGVKVAQAEGLAAVSMSRVAAELGTGPMSLYRYVAAKEEVLS